MRDPVLVDVATLQPGRCLCCGTIDGPFVDTMVDTFDGRVYVCAHKCLRIFAGLAGMSDQAELEQKLQDASVATGALAAQLEEQQPLIDAVRAAFPRPTVTFPKGTIMLPGPLVIDGDVEIVADRIEQVSA